MPTDYPQELVEEILDHLKEDADSLRTCSLVCRAWVSRCRSHLFETCPLYPDSIVGFRDLLRFPCTFLPHIRRIEAVRHDWDENDHCFDKIGSILSSLVGIHELELILYIVHAKENSILSRGFMVAFPHVTRLSLSFPHGDFDAEPGVPIIDVICLFPALQDLNVGTFFGVVAIPSPNAVPPPGLRCLKIHGDALRPVLKWLDTSGHIPNMDAVTLFSMSDVGVVSTVMQQLGGTLHHLDFDLSYLADLTYWSPNVDPSTIFNLALHPNLKTLTIRDDGYRNDFDPDQLFQLIMGLAAFTLERFSLDLDLSHFENLNWAALDTFLCAPRFPRLRSVIVKCCRHREIHKHDDHPFLHGALPLLEASELLRIERCGT
ncbi:hypothetical protein MVEN_02268300 [Mycena venus]|uniref:F-box domain-containing protein n=1 Tax=Mycena venus TaxID=2733690 RepID=A0A8H7CGA1_9AGAR|nr:hypothetical protein MVEN_02268300 [Mycena venus]